MVRHVWWSPYSIEMWQKPSREGALICLEDDQGRIGYADLHPWPELGDPSLADLKNEMLTFQAHLESTEPACADLLVSAYKVAQFDARARAERWVVGRGRVRPLSHRQLRCDETLTEEFNRARAEGFTHVKIKMGDQLSRESQLLASAISGADSVQVRLDFNGKLSRQQFLNWWQEWGKHHRESFDAIEDPWRGSAGPDEGLGVGSNVDRTDPAWTDLIFWDRERSQNMTNQVLKPEIQGPQRPRVSGRWFVTNNLGHPYGHAVALGLATEWQCSEVCGLQGLEFQGQSNWTERIRYVGPVTLSENQTGFGFGFGDLLSRCRWQRLF